MRLRMRFALLRLRRFLLGVGGARMWFEKGTALGELQAKQCLRIILRAELDGGGSAGATERVRRRGTVDYVVTIR
jgi:hypothetical protein